MTALSDGAARARPLPAASRPPTGEPPLPPPPRASASPTMGLLAVLIVVLFSGGLFGYDQGVISGALTGIKSTFSLSPFLVEVVTSWVTLGALLGALAGGELADRIGRKRAVLIAGALFTLGAAVQAFCPGDHGSRRGAADHWRRRRRRGGGRAALRGGTRARFVARPFCLRLSARHNDRHLSRLSD